MKCTYCGNNLTIDDAKCPFCGKENAFAKKHRSQMAHYKEEFDNTKQTVEVNTKKISATAIRITIVAVLAALNILLLLIIETGSYDLKRMYRSSLVEKDLAVHLQKMDDYETNRDFMKLGVYYEENYLEDNEHFYEYEMVSRVCQQYKQAYAHLMDIVTGEENESYTNQEKLKYMVSNINYMYRWAEVNAYDKNGCFAPKHKECMDAAIEQMGDLLVTYCGLSKEDVSKLEDMSEAQREVLIGRGLDLYE